jgi:anti-sigma-K factor RskA
MRIWRVIASTVAVALVATFLVTALLSRTSSAPPVVRLVSVEPAGIMDDSGAEMWLATLEPVMHLVEKMSVHSIYIWPLPLGWQMYEKHIRVM